MYPRTVVVSAPVLASTLSCRASLIGDQVDTRYLDPNTSSVYTDAGTQVVSDGTAATFSGLVTVTFHANEIDVTNVALGA